MIDAIALSQKPSMSVKNLSNPGQDDRAVDYVNLNTLNSVSPYNKFKLRQTAPSATDIEVRMSCFSNAVYRTNKIFDPNPKPLKPDISVR